MSTSPASSTPHPGSTPRASFGRRLGAFAIDGAASALVAALFIPDPADPARGVLGMAVLATEYLVLLVLVGQTLGMRLLGLRVVRVAAPEAPVGLVAVAVRTALLMLLLPAVIRADDGRELHDRAAGTTVVRV